MLSAHVGGQRWCRNIVWVAALQGPSGTSCNNTSTLLLRSPGKPIHIDSCISTHKQNNRAKVHRTVFVMQLFKAKLPEPVWSVVGSQSCYRFLTDRCNARGKKHAHGCLLPNQLFTTAYKSFKNHVRSLVSLLLPVFFSQFRPCTRWHVL
jgi:hypothetical protein